MFGGGDGEWDESWTGWWGDDPPYHAPVFDLDGVLVDSRVAIAGCMNHALRS